MNVYKNQPIGEKVMNKKYFNFLTLILISSFVFFSCEEDADPADTEVQTPVVTSISPVEGYPGEEVTITGENFNTVASMNLIELDSNGVSLASVTPTEGTATTLKFTRPNVSGVGVSISANLKVRNVEDPDEKVSDSVSITLLPIFDIITVAGLPKTKGGLAFDADGNLYARGQDPAEVYKITPEGVESYFGQTHWGEGEMHFGPDGYLYAAVVWGDYGIVRIPPGGGDYEEYMPADIHVDNPFDFDWDSDGNMYIGTADGTIYRRSANADTATLIKSYGYWGSPMRYYDGDLYWWTKGDTVASAGGENGLWKAAVPAEGDTISPASSTQILSSDDHTPSGLAIDGMGNTYLMDGWIDADDTTGTITQDLVRVTPTGTVESIYTLPTQNPNKAVWHDNKLYVAKGNQGNQIYVIYLGPDYATGAVPQY
jgi:hypothetical protein